MIHPVTLSSCHRVIVSRNALRLRQLTLHHLHHQVVEPLN
jgi:hypothetical protein